MSDTTTIRAESATVVASVIRDDAPHILVCLTMNRKQKLEAVRRILGEFTANQVASFLLAEFGELVQERSA